MASMDWHGRVSTARVSGWVSSVCRTHPLTGAVLTRLLDRDLV